jgi:ATP-binding cassette subfamily E protein 1
VLGLLGTNGIGKSTVLSILSGRVKPNLGRFEPPLATWSDVVKYYRGSDLQNYFTMVLENKLRVAIKPQLDPSFARRLKGQVVRDLIAARDERKVMHRVVQELDLEHVLDREVQQLSGGEVSGWATQTATAAAACASFPGQFSRANSKLPKPNPTHSVRPCSSSVLPLPLQS